MNNQNTHLHDILYTHVAWYKLINFDILLVSTLWLLSVHNETNHINISASVNTMFWMLMTISKVSVQLHLHHTYLLTIIMKWASDGIRENKSCIVWNYRNLSDDSQIDNNGGNTRQLKITRVEYYYPEKKKVSIWAHKMGDPLHFRLRPSGTQKSAHQLSPYTFYETNITYYYIDTWIHHFF